MPKLKTNKAAKKRYHYTATDKVKRTKANRRHRLATKTTRNKLPMLLLKTSWIRMYSLFRPVTTEPMYRRSIR